MAFYKSFSTNTTYDSNDVVGFQESSSGSTVVSLDLSSFAEKYNPVFSGDEVYLKQGVRLNMAGSVQNSALTDERVTDISTSKLKTTDISYTENETHIANTLDLTDATVQLADEHISQSKITGLVTRLTEIDRNLANINSNDVDIAALNTLTADHTSRLNANDVTNTTQDGRISTNETDIVDIKTNIVTVEGNVAQNLINNTANLSSINSLNTLTATHTSDISLLKTADTQLANDISTNLTAFNNYVTATDLELGAINSTLIDHDTLNTAQDTRLTAIETLNVTQDGRLTAVETLNTAQDGRLDAIETLNVAQDSRLDAIETLNTSQGTDISSLQATSLSNTNNITALQVKDVSLDGDIATLNSQMATKQAIINNANKLNVSLLGNGDVSNARLSALNDVRTDVSLQTQLNTLNTSLSALDALQDFDLVNIPLLQTDTAQNKSDITALQSTTSANSSAIASNDTDITNLQTSVATNAANISTNDTDISNLQSSVATNATGITALVNSDTLIQSDITALQSQDALLQANINLKNDLISLTNQLNSSLIFDTSENDSLDNIISTIDSNLTLLSTSKQDVISGVSKLDASLIDTSTSPLQYVDIIAPLQAQLTSINSAISTLQGLTTNDTISTFQDIEDNFDALQLNKLDKSVYDVTIAPEITAIQNSISTLQGLQDGDILSFQNINASITNLTNTKQPLITPTAKLNSSLLNRDDSLQHVDVTSSITGSLATLQTNIDAKQDVISGTNKLDAALLDTSTSALRHVDITAPLQAQLTTLNSSISTLNSYDVAQTAINTSHTNQLNTHSSDIAAVQTLANTNASKLVDTTHDGTYTNVTQLKSDKIQVNDVGFLGKVNDVFQISTNDGIGTPNASMTLNSGGGALTLYSSVIALGNHLGCSVTMNGETQTSAFTETLKSGIGTNTTNIATNTADIASLQSTVSGIDTIALAETQAQTNTNTTDIATLQTDLAGIDLSGIATNATNISTVQTQANTNTTNIATNTADISSLQSTVSGIDIIALAETQSQTTSNTSAIAAVQAQVNTNKNDISSTADAILVNLSDIDILKTSVGTLQTDLANLDVPASKIETISSTLSYTTPSNVLTHTYNEENIFLNLLDDNNVIQLDLTIAAPVNNKSYLQTVVIDCLQYKGYVHTLNINGSPVEIKHKNGDTNINLAPIAGYSLISQTFNMMRVADTWYAMSDIKLFYNSASNSTFDGTPPEITLIGNAVVNHEINTTYTDAGASALDNVDGDITGSIVVGGDSVNTAVLGAYSITYDVADAKGNAATQKVRVVNVVDTTNPVVTLVGLGEVTYSQGTYVEEGATATDNSLETLTVVIGGTLIDENTTPGDYTVTYTATDSSANTHQIGRLVHITAPEAQLVYTNSTTNIFDLMNFGSYLGPSDTTLKNFAVTGNASAYLNGDYQFAYSSHYSGYKGYYAIRGGHIFVGQRILTNGAHPVYSHIYEPFQNSDSHVYDYLSTGNYQGSTCELLAGGTVNVFFTHFCDSNSTTYNGEFLEWKFPFLLEVSKLQLVSDKLPTQSVLLGSADDGVTWEYISTIDIPSQVSPHDAAISTTLKYSRFKWICTNITRYANMWLTQIKIYGDVYA